MIFLVHPQEINWSQFTQATSYGLEWPIFGSLQIGVWSGLNTSRSPIQWPCSTIQWPPLSQGELLTLAPRLIDLYTILSCGSNLPSCNPINLISFLAPFKWVYISLPGGHNAHIHVRFCLSSSGVWMSFSWSSAWFVSEDTRCHTNCLEPYHTVNSPIPGLIVVTSSFRWCADPIITFSLQRLPRPAHILIRLLHSYTYDVHVAHYIFFTSRLPSAPYSKYTCCI